MRILLLLLLPSFLMAQNAIYEEPTKKQADSLRIEFQILINDTIRINICSKLGVYYQETNIDSSIYFYNRQLKLLCVNFKKSFRVCVSFSECIRSKFPEQKAQILP